MHAILIDSGCIIHFLRCSLQKCHDCLSSLVGAPSYTHSRFKPKDPLYCKNCFVHKYVSIRTRVAAGRIYNFTAHHVVCLLGVNCNCFGCVRSQNDRCTTCCRALRGVVVRINKQPFHKECCRCTRCKKKLDKDSFRWTSDTWVRSRVSHTDSKCIETHVKLEHDGGSLVICNILFFFAAPMFRICIAFPATMTYSLANAMRVKNELLLNAGHYWTSDTTR